MQGPQELSNLKAQIETKIRKMREIAKKNLNNETQANGLFLEVRGAMSTGEHARINELVNAISSLFVDKDKKEIRKLSQELVTLSTKAYDMEHPKKTQQVRKEPTFYHQPQPHTPHGKSLPVPPVRSEEKVRKAELAIEMVTNYIKELKQGKENRNPLEKAARSAYKGAKKSIVSFVTKKEYQGKEELAKALETKLKEIVWEVKQGKAPNVDDAIKQAINSVKEEKRYTLSKDQGGFNKFLEDFGKKLEKAHQEKEKVYHPKKL